MNQILSMQMQKEESINKNKGYKNSNNKIAVASAVRLFAILILIFGIILIGDSVYGIVSSVPKEKDNPSVSTESIGAEAIIRIVTQKPLKQMTYRWGDGEETVVEGNGTVELEVTIDIPTGNNILNIKVTDYYGNETEYQKQYINQRTDNTKPTIEISSVGSKLNIRATDNTEMSYIAYKWNEEEETRVDIDENAQDKKTLETRIEVKKGQNTLTIIAVDKDGNRETRTETIKGANKPTFEITSEGNNLLINAKDEEGISKISITVDGVTTDTGNTPINQKEVTARQELTSGSHTITVIVTNMSGLTEEQSFTAVL